MWLVYCVSLGLNRSFNSITWWVNISCDNLLLCLFRITKLPININSRFTNSIPCTVCILNTRKWRHDVFYFDMWLPGRAKGWLFHQYRISPNLCKHGKDKSSATAFPFSKCSWFTGPKEYWLCSIDINRHSCLPSVISVHTESHLMGETQKIFFFFFCSALHVCFFLPGSAMTHPRLCRAHSCPGSVMSLGFSVASTVCPVCIGGKRGREDIAFSVREKDKNKPP